MLSASKNLHSLYKHVEASVPQTSVSVNASDGMSLSLGHTGEGCVSEQRCGMNICVGCVIVHDESAMG